MDKNIIRKHIKQIRQSLSDEYIKEKSSIIEDKIFAMEIIARADVVMAYFSMPSEVNTHGMIERLLSMGKKVALPKSMTNTCELEISLISSLADLKPGPYGIMEPDEQKVIPIDFREVDIVIVPGVAFDRFGHRIGHGKGYYDRFLAKLTESQLKIGLCFDFQLYDRLCVEDFDISVDCVISDLFP